MADELPPDLWDKIRAIAADEVAKFARSGFLRNASISGGRLTIADDGSIASDDYDGAGLADPGTTGWWLGGADGGAVFNTLALRKGIIGNEALSDPIDARKVGGNGSNFEVPTVDVVVASGSTPIPAGFTTAYVLAVGTVGVRNTSTVGDFLYARTRLAVPGRTIDGSEHPVRIDAATFEPLTTQSGAALSNLDGGALTVSQLLHHGSGATWAAATTNRADLDALVLFLR